MLFHSLYISLLLYDRGVAVHTVECIITWLSPLGDPVGDNDRELSGEVLADAWILDVKQLSWTKVVARAKYATMYGNTSL